MENGVQMEMIEIVAGRIVHSEFLELGGEGSGAVSYLRFEGDGDVIIELYRGTPPAK